jgi:transcriptional regulator with XRE-family HTH domain
MRREVLLKKLGEMIRLKRRTRNLTQMKLAELIGCSLQAIGNIERGCANASVVMIYKIAEALEISVKELLP